MYLLYPNVTVPGAYFVLKNALYSEASECLELESTSITNLM